MVCADPTHRDKKISTFEHIESAHQGLINSSHSSLFPNYMMKRYHLSAKHISYLYYVRDVPFKGPPKGGSHAICYMAFLWVCYML